MPSSYEKLYARSLKDPEGYWAEAAEDVHWYKRWDKVFDDSRQPFYQWFKGGVVNSCYDALDLHVASGRADQPALVYDSAVTDTIETFAYRQPLDQVARFAGVLASLGVEKYDRVVIYMPMVPETVVAMRSRWPRQNRSERSFSSVPNRRRPCSPEEIWAVDRRGRGENGLLTWSSARPSRSRWTTSEAAMKELESKGVPVVAPLNESPVCHFACIADPDGNTVWLHRREDGTFAD